MLEAFNDFADVGPAHSLNNANKINTFKQGLTYLQVICWWIISKERWDNFPPAEQTFDIFYKQFSKYISNYKAISSISIRSYRIGAFNT